MNKEILKKLFSYHPPKNDQEKELHEIVNEASLQYAMTLAEVVKDPDELISILGQIQKVRMLANSAVSNDRVGISYKDLFKSE